MKKKKPSSFLPNLIVRRRTKTGGFTHSSGEKVIGDAGSEYKEDDVEFMLAMDCYKRASGRKFPTCSEVLDVLKSLGYRKVKEMSHEDLDN